MSDEPVTENRPRTSLRPFDIAVFAALGVTIAMFMATASPHSSLWPYRPHAACAALALVVFILVGSAVVCAWRRSWPRFGLRTFGAFVVLTSVVAAWMGIEINRADRRWQASKRLHGASADVERPDWFGRVFLEYPDAALARHDEVADALELPELCTLVANDDLFSEQQIRALHGLPRLESLRMRGASLDDAGLVAIASHEQLLNLELSRTNGTPSGLAVMLGRMPQLRTLALESVELNEDAFAAIGRMRELWWLELGACRFDAASLRQLQTAEKLQVLNINRSSLTNEELSSLGELKRLEDLSLDRTHLSAIGFDHLSRLRALRLLELDAFDQDEDAIRAIQRCPRLEAILPAVPSNTFEFDARIAHLNRSYLYRLVFPPRPRLSP